MFSIRIRGAPMSILMVILVLMFVVPFATATDSSVIKDQQAIINVDFFNAQIVDFNSALVDGLAVNTQLVMNIEKENVVSTSDSVGIFYSFAVLNVSADQFASSDVVTNTAVFTQHTFITTTTDQGALLPGSTLVVQQFANTGTNVGYVDIGNRPGSPMVANYA